MKKVKYTMQKKKESEIENFPLAWKVAFSRKWLQEIKQL